MCANLLYRGFFVINYREILRLHAQEITQSGIALGIREWSKWTKNLLLCLQGKNNYSIKRDLIKVISICVVGSLLVMAIPFFFRIFS